MPVKDAKAYGPGWKEFSLRIRFERAAGRCEFIMTAAGRCPKRHGDVLPSGGKVVLTVAHLCHDPGCRDEAHVLAACQACHLAYDRALHSRNASATAKRKRLARAPELPFAAGVRQ